MRRLLLASLIPLLGGCSVFESKTQSSYALSRNWGIGWDHDIGTAFTTADVRMITKRRHPVMHNLVLCTEPSPDVAAALAASIGAKATGGSGAINGGLDLSGSSAETVAELAGRSSALLGLRDGLFRACESYANGVLGQDAYALVLAHYGELMTTLFLAQDVTGAAGAEGKALATAAIAAATAASNDKPAAASPMGGAVKTSANGTQETLAAMLTPIAAFGALTKPIAQPVSVQTPPAADKAMVPASPAKNPTAPTADTKATPAAQAAGVSASAALVLARMNEDYMYEGVLQGILVACINEADPTRLSTPLDTDGNLPASAPMYVEPTDRKSSIKNPWLRPICDAITLASIEKYQQLVNGLEKVDPTKMPPADAVPKSQPTKPKTSPNRPRPAVPAAGLVRPT